MTSRYDHLLITEDRVGLPGYVIILDNDERCWEVGTILAGTAIGALARRRRADLDPSPGLRKGLSAIFDHQPTPETLRLVECASRVRCTRYTEDCHYHHKDIRRPCSCVGPIHSDICNDWAGVVRGCTCYIGLAPPMDMTAEMYALMFTMMREIRRRDRGR